MQLTKIAVVVLVLIARLCRSEIVIATPSRDESTASLVDGLANIVTSCYGDRIEVGLIGRRHDDLARTLSGQHFIPVVLIDPSKIYSTTLKTQFHHKLHVFVLEGDVVLNFPRLVDFKLQYSISWNHLASFFIIDRSPECDNAFNYLTKAWSADLLNAKCLCHHRRHGRVISTYNPYTSDAPTPWRRIFVRTINKHPFTLLQREYPKNASVCVNLDFEKSKNLGGYPILIRGKPLGDKKHGPFSLRINQYWRKHETILTTLSHTLNASLVFVGLGFHVDIAKDSRLMILEARDDRESSYPHEQTGLIIITQFRGHKSQLDKILSVIDVDSRIGLGIVYLITLIFLKFFVHQALLPALLNLVRITCNTGFLNLTHHNAARVYLTSLLFFVVTMQGIYQGKLAARLTQQVPLRQVNTMQDVAEFGYKLYAPQFVTHLLDDLELKERFTRVEDTDKCFAHVINDSSAACLLRGEGRVYDLAQEHDLHLSSEFVEMYHMGFGIRWNWPPQRRIDLTIQKMVEADILEEWNDKLNQPELGHYQIDKEVQKNKSFKKIELGELAFAFIILGIGLLCATITFIVELAIQYKCIFMHRQIRN